MKRLILLGVCVLGFLSATAWGIDIKNVRPLDGPKGKVRKDNKFKAGDTIHITYDLCDLAADPKTKKFRYETTFEFFDANGKIQSTITNPTEIALKIPENTEQLTFPIDRAQAKGKYKIRLTVTDKVNGKAKAFQYTVEVK